MQKYALCMRWKVYWNREVKKSQQTNFIANFPIEPSFRIEGLWINQWNLRLEGNNSGIWIKVFDGTKDNWSKSDFMNCNAYWISCFYKSQFDTQLG